MTAATGVSGRIELASLCTCGMGERERLGHSPEHQEWCEVSDDDAQCDTVESQKARVAAVMAAGHTATQVRELGYARSICSACRCGWPCPDFAQAAEWRA